MTNRILTMAMLAVVLLMGCDLNRHTGEQGQIVFEYYSAEDYTNFNKPIIEGGYVDLFLYTVGYEETPVEVLSAKSLNPEIARVEGHVANLMVVQGVTAGRATFEVRAEEEDGSVRVDRLSLRVDRARTIRFYGGQATVISEGPNATSMLPGEKRSEDGDGEEEDDEPSRVQSLTFETGDRVKIPWTRYSATGEPLIGYGVYPISIEPAGAAKLHDRITDDDSFTLFMPDEPQTFEVVPAAGYSGDRLIIEVVEPSLLEGAADEVEDVADEWMAQLVPSSQRGTLHTNESHRVVDGFEPAAAPRHVTVERRAELVAQGLGTRFLLLWLAWAVLGCLAVVWWGRRPSTV